MLIYCSGVCWGVWWGGGWLLNPVRQFISSLGWVIYSIWNCVIPNIARVICRYKTSVKSVSTYKAHHHWHTIAVAFMCKVHVNWTHIQYLWYTSMTAWLHHGKRSLQKSAWPVQAELIRYLGNSTVSFSINRQLQIRITAWVRFGIHRRAKKDWVYGIKYADTYFTDVNVSSEFSSFL